VHALRTDVPARSPLRVRRRRRPRPAFSSSKAWWPTWRRGGADRRRPARSREDGRREASLWPRADGAARRCEDL